MKFTRKHTTHIARLLALFAAVCVLTSVGAAGPVSEEDEAKIREAVPKKPMVRVIRPRRLLVFTLTKGFRHSSIEHGIAALTIMGETTGAFRVTATEDPDAFAAESLENYDAVCFLNTTGNLFENETYRANLLKFVRDGKGIVGIHAATDTFYEWEDFGDLMGGYFDGHPWNSHSTVTLKIDEPEHPINNCFHGEPFTVTDEIYQMKDPYSRDRQRVLTSLDTNLTNMTLPGIKRTDDDFAVSWIRKEELGRVFYCSLGHREDIYWNPVVLEHYLAGIQFALGDLRVHADPIVQPDAGEDDGQTSNDDDGNESPQAHAPSELDQMLAACAAYRFGESRAPLVAVQNHVYQVMDADTDAREQAEAGLITFLEQADATTDAQCFACRMLSLIGSARCVPTLAEFLTINELSDSARDALESNPSADASAALVLAIQDSTDESFRARLIISLGNRGDAEALEHLAPLLVSSDRNVQLALIDAMAEAGFPNQGLGIPKMIEKAQRERNEEMVAHLYDALLKTAARNARTPDGRAVAVTLYQSLLEGWKPAEYEQLGLRGLAHVAPMQAVTYLADYLEDEWNPESRVICASILATAPDTPEFNAMLPDLFQLIGSDVAKVTLIEALARRGHPSSGPFLLDVMNGSTGDVQIAAVGAIGSVGGVNSLDMLATLAAKSATHRKRRDAARSGMYQLNHPSAQNVNDAIVRLMENTNTPDAVEAELVLALGARQVDSARALIAQRLEFDSPLVRTAAWSALGTLAGGTDIQAMLQAILSLQGNETKDEYAAAQITLVQLVQRLPESERDELDDLAAISLLACEDHEVQTVLLHTLAAVGSGDALKTVKNWKSSAASDEAQKVANEALATWSNRIGIDTLLALARESHDDQSTRTLAIRAVTRIAVEDTELNAKITNDILLHAYPLAQTGVERSTVLTAMTSRPHGASLPTVLSALEDASTQRAAARAAMAIAKTIAPEDRDAAHNAIETVLASVRSAGLRNEARAALNVIEQDEDFITAWQFAGPYMDDNLEAGELLDHEFAPEFDSAETTNWIDVPAGAIVNPGFVDILRLNRGSNRCAYLRTSINVPAPTTAKLEIGSDDGVKVWLNGEVVHVNNAMRGMSRAQDVIEVQLNEGANTLMLKVSQGGGDWGACCRVRASDGSHIDGIRFSSS